MRSVKFVRMLPTKTKVDHSDKRTRLGRRFRAVHLLGLLDGRPSRELPSLAAALQRARVI